MWLLGEEHIERGKRVPKTRRYKQDHIKYLIEKGPNGDKELHLLTPLSEKSLIVVINI